MPDIFHRIRIAAPQANVYRAINTIDGLAAWWTRTTTGATGVGERIAFRFGSHVTTMEVRADEPEQRVEWRCVDSNPDWLGTRVAFVLTADDQGTMLSFTHGDWRESSDFMGHCSMKWATFLLSLRDYVQSGRGLPFPDDIAV
jgi:uncharacterized protein YndB with AHSA1/START domain